MRVVICGALGWVVSMSVLFGLVVLLHSYGRTLGDVGYLAGMVFGLIGVAGGSTLGERLGRQNG